MKPYATPTLTNFGSVKNVTSASVCNAGLKGGASSECNPGQGQGDVRRT